MSETTEPAMITSANVETSEASSVARKPLQQSGDLRSSTAPLPQSDPGIMPAISNSHEGSQRSSIVSGVTASCGCQTSSATNGGYVYSLGTLRYDFGTEARRDGFKQRMPQVAYTKDGSYPYIAYYDPNDLQKPIDLSPPYPPNPYDVEQVAHYLAGFPYPSPPYPVRGGLASFSGRTFDKKREVVIKDDRPRFPKNGKYGEVCAVPDRYPGFEGDLSEANELIWVLYIEETPIYALRPTRQFSTEVYQSFVETIAGQSLASTDEGFIERVSIAGTLTGEKVQLFSGQKVDVVEPKLRGMFSWNTNVLVTTAIEAVKSSVQATSNEKGLAAEAVDLETQKAVSTVQQSLRQFLDRIYFDLRNPGRSSADRALNFAATNAFQGAVIMTDAATQGMQLDYIGVEQSTFCRMDSDCWDVKLKFFDPDNDRRARKVYRYTIDVSDSYPVQIGELRVWSESGYQR